MIEDIFKTDYLFFLIVGRIKKQKRHCNNFAMTFYKILNL